MVAGSTKKIVVIRDIPSNIIEEAILILRCEPGNTPDSGVRDDSKKDKKADNDFLLKEAELIINNYVKEHKTRGACGDEASARRAIFKRKFMPNIVINLALAGCIALFVLLLTRLI